MNHPSPSLGELELEILKVIWQEQPCTVAQVAQLMASRHGHARTTVLTVIQRLAAKGFVKRRKQGGVFHYSTTKKQSAILDGLVRRFVDTVLDGSALPFVAYLAESKDLTNDQVRSLRAIARKLDKNEQGAP